LITQILLAVGKLHRKYHFIILAFFAIFTILCLEEASHLEIQANMEKMIPQDVEVIRNTNLIRDEFGGGDFIIIAIGLDRDSQTRNKVIDIRDPRVLSYIEELENRIKKEPEVSNVQSILDFLPYIPSSLEESRSLIDKNFFARQWISEDYSLTSIRIQTFVASDEKQLNDFVERIKMDVENTGKPSGIKTELTGIVMVRKTLFELIKQDGVRITMIGYLLIFITLSLTLASIKRGILPLISVTLAIIWTAGTLTFLGVPVSVMTIGIAPMLLGLGIDYGIHITHRLREEAGNPEKAEKTLTTTGKAILATSATTMVGFGSLLLAKMPGLRDFGALGVVGMFYAMFAALFCLPSLFLAKERFHPAEKISKISKFEKTVKKFFEFQLKKYKIFLLLCFLMLAIFSSGFKGLTMESSSEKSLPQDLPVIRSMYSIRDNFGGAEMVIAIFEVDKKIYKEIRNKKVIDYIIKAENLFKDEKYVSQVFGLPEELKFNYGRIPEENELKKIESPLISDDLSMCISFISVDVGTDTKKIKELMRNLYRDAAMLSEEGIKIKFAGSPAVSWVTGKLMMQDFSRVTLVALVLVFSILYLDLRSFRRSILVASPLLIALYLTFATLGYLKVPLRPETIGLASTILGIGIDYSILITHRYLEERDLIKGLIKTARSILSSSTTTIMGFSALSFATMLGLKNMGLSMTIGIAFCTLSVILFFPVILYLGDARKYKRE